MKKYYFNILKNSFQERTDIFLVHLLFPGEKITSVKASLLSRNTLFLAGGRNNVPKNAIEIPLRTSARKAIFSPRFPCGNSPREHQLLRTPPLLAFRSNSKQIQIEWKMYTAHCYHWLSRNVAVNGQISKQTRQPKVHNAKQRFWRFGKDNVKYRFYRSTKYNFMLVKEMNNKYVNNSLLKIILDYLDTP